MGPGPGSIIGELTGRTAGVHAEVDAPRQYQRGRVAGVDWDVETDAAHNTRPGDPPGEQLHTASGDERLVPGGEAEQEFAAKSARHRAGRWSLDDAVLVDLRDVREGRYGPAS
jgi:hypothetical protein